VPADDEIERAFALADAALADEQHAQAEDVHQHGMHHRALGERILEHRRQLRDRHRRRHGRFQQRQARAFRFDDQLYRRLESAGNEHTREIERQREAHRRDARRRLEALEVADLALAEDEDAARFQVLVKAREGEAGLLDVGTGDDAVQTVGARQQLERQTERFGPAAEQRADGDAGRASHVKSSVACRPSSVYSRLLTGDR
jgi:hypothetical protein